MPPQDWQGPAAGPEPGFVFSFASPEQDQAPQASQQAPEAEGASEARPGQKRPARRAALDPIQLKREREKEASKRYRDRQRLAKDETQTRLAAVEAENQNLRGENSALRGQCVEQNRAVLEGLSALVAEVRGMQEVLRAVAGGAGGVGSAGRAGGLVASAALKLEGADGVSGASSLPASSGAAISTPGGSADDGGCLTSFQATLPQAGGAGVAPVAEAEPFPQFPPFSQFPQPRPPPFSGNSFAPLFPGQPAGFATAGMPTGVQAGLPTAPAAAGAYETPLPGIPMEADGRPGVVYTEAYTRGGGVPPAGAYVPGYAAEYTRDYSRDYLRDYSRDYARTYPEAHTPAYGWSQAGPSVPAGPLASEQVKLEDAGLMDPANSMNPTRAHPRPHTHAHPQAHSYAFSSPHLGSPIRAPARASVDSTTSSVPPASPASPTASGGSPGSSRISSHSSTPVVPMPLFSRPSGQAQSGHFSVFFVFLLLALPLTIFPRFSNLFSRFSPRTESQFPEAPFSYLSPLAPSSLPPSPQGFRGFQGPSIPGACWSNHRGPGATPLLNARMGASATSSSLGGFPLDGGRLHGEYGGRAEQGKYNGLGNYSPQSAYDGSTGFSGFSGFGGYDGYNEYGAYNGYNGYSTYNADDHGQAAGGEYTPAGSTALGQSEQARRLSELLARKPVLTGLDFVGMDSSAFCDVPPSERSPPGRASRVLDATVQAAEEARGSDSGIFVPKDNVSSMCQEYFEYERFFDAFPDLEDGSIRLFLDTLCYGSDWDPERGDSSLAPQWSKCPVLGRGSSRGGVHDVFEIVERGA